MSLATQRFDWCSGRLFKNRPSRDPFKTHLSRDLSYMHSVAVRTIAAIMPESRKINPKKFVWWTYNRRWGWTYNRRWSWGFQTESSPMHLKAMEKI